MRVKLKVNGKVAEVSSEQTVLDACKTVGADVPTLCHEDGLEHFTSCMLCVVKDMKTGKLIPSCTAPALEGMEIETDTDDIRVHRKAALELLLAEHLGDCEGPCQRGCPASMNIPLMIRQIKAGRFRDSLITVKQEIVLPAILGRICPAPCEKVCRRAQFDGGVSICHLKRFVADVDLASGSPWVPGLPVPTGKSVAIVGAGPMGLGAAAMLARKGYRCVVFEAQGKAGGTLRTAVPEEKLPRNVVDAEVETIAKLGVEFRTGMRVGKDVTIAELKKEFAAIVVAVGAMNSTDAKEVFGVEPGGKGIKVNPQTFRSSDPMIFSGGAAIAECKMAIRALANANAVAESVDQFLRGAAVTGLPKRFNSVIGRAVEKERQEFFKEATDVPRVEAAGGHAVGLSEGEAARESGRCLHCDCRKPESCRLRLFSDKYGASQKTYKPETRKPFETNREHPTVVYEAGKCIKCGICVRITEKMAEPYGLTFLGRGFDLKIAVPFGKTLADGLTSSADACVKACPTGALSYASCEETEVR